MPKITLKYIDENIKNLTKDLNSNDSKNNEKYRNNLLLFIEALFIMRDKIKT